jgi:hypothetical protein
VGVLSNSTNVLPLTSTLSRILAPATLALTRAVMVLRSAAKGIALTSGMKMPPLVAPEGLTILSALPEPPVGPATTLGSAPPNLPVSVMEGVASASSKETSTVPIGVGVGAGAGAGAGVGAGVEPTTTAVTLVVTDPARVAVFGPGGLWNTAALAGLDTAAVMPVSDCAVLVTAMREDAGALRMESA